MKLIDYLEAIKVLVEENPERLQMEVVYSTDDEGNDYSCLIYTTSVASFLRDGRQLDRVDDAGYEGSFEAIVIN